MWYIVLDTDMLVWDMRMYDFTVLRACLADHECHAQNMPVGRNFISLLGSCVCRVWRARHVNYEKWKSLLHRK